MEFYAVVCIRSYVPLGRLPTPPPSSLHLPNAGKSPSTASLNFKQASLPSEEDIMQLLLSRNRDKATFFYLKPPVPPISLYGGNKYIP